MITNKQKEIKKGEDFDLTPKQSLFCELYSLNEEFFGNGVQSYIEAYNPKRKGNWYNSAKTSAFDNLTKPNILNYINYLLELRGLNDSFVDKQLELLITQNADFRAKLGAIKEYNQLKSRIKIGFDKNNPLFIQLSDAIAEKRKINETPSSPK